MIDIDTDTTDPEVTIAVRQTVRGKVLQVDKLLIGQELIDLRQRGVVVARIIDDALQEIKVAAQAVIEADASKALPQKGQP